ncbi:ABC transporter substrate-binding protein [Frankia sp. CNm7]|uniref:ABC transporter substrate-binding protein n=1 Tax=Frankia nepalensis TaxID=1836974 RepID=A0A937UPG4_9ACTN|nr:ABC transporter substrate-binding protein [Frankia nepalensis]MBL7499766.1 ABC transporter substrate-binding protein [Frankia nepalensis]MBL7512251.1 ABC transporter substrate-binding protein [Frankia nepalensis]MBL7524089.1 ABC transporter substrate-binding protein [Frankia nepalensis]MBL7629053.1 ABC transporter substrate-binding protein [Frankia nepalensis]
MRRSRLVVLSVAALALVGACSSGGEDDAPDQRVVEVAGLTPGPSTGWSADGVTVDAASLECAGPAADPTRGVTDTEIKVGGLVNLTSPNGSTMAGAEIGAQVRFDRANDEGGVHGRTINYAGTFDDGNDPARNGQQARAMVEQEKVFAAVPLNASQSAYKDVFCAQKVPFFGWGTNPGYCENTIGFGFTGCLFPRDGVSSTTYGLMVQSMFDGNGEGKTVALVGMDNDAAREGLLGISRQITTVDIDVVYEKNPVPVTGLTDTTAIVNDLMTADKGAPADAVLMILDFPSTTKLTEALTAAGYQGKTHNAVAYDPRLAGFQALQGVYTTVQWQPGIDTDVPAIAQMTADFQKYAPEQTLSLLAMAGYWTADMFLDALDKTGPDLTVDNLLNTLNGGDYTYSVADAVPETRWPLNHASSSPCASLVQLVDQNFRIVQDLSCGAWVKLN